MLLGKIRTHPSDYKGIAMILAGIALIAFGYPLAGGLVLAASAVLILTTME